MNTLDPKTHEMLTAEKPKANKIINLALQGGGAHGAYTWGVLDRLLEDERIVIEGISGTSAGALNGAALIHGFETGGYEGAKKTLLGLWKEISQAAFLNPWRQNPWTKFWGGGWNLDNSPGYIMYDLFSRFYSPYNLNPFNINPMRTILQKLLDIKVINCHEGIKLFVTATSVRTGRPEIFSCKDITIEVLLASSCLPFLYQAVEINGEAYWDGGYSGNPALWPVIYHCKSHDLMLVQINPFVREEVPKKASEIIDRVNEISFNASLIAEFRAIKFVSKLIRDNRLDRADYKDLRTHLIFSPKELHNLDASSKMNADWDFFLYLKNIGRTAMDSWLEKNFSHLGRKSTFSFNEIFKLKKKPAEKNS